MLMVLPISMSVHEIQCGSPVHFCMVNSFIKIVDTIVFSDFGVLRLAHIYIYIYTRSFHSSPLLTFVGFDLDPKQMDNLF